MMRVRAGARVAAQLGLEFLGDRSCLDEEDQAPGEVLFLRPGGASQMASRRAVT